MDRCAVTAPATTLSDSPIWQTRCKSGNCGPIHRAFLETGPWKWDETERERRALMDLQFSFTYLQDISRDVAVKAGGSLRRYRCNLVFA